MTLSTDDIEDVRTAVQSEGDIPRVFSHTETETVVNEDGEEEEVETDVYRNRMNLLGALNQLERIAGDLDEYGITVSELPDEKRETFEQAHEDFQYWVSLLANKLPEDIAGLDESIELDNGNEIDLPLDPMEAGEKEVQLPDQPSE